MKPITISFQDIVENNAISGGSFNYYEITKLMPSLKEFKLVKHDICDLLKGDKKSIQSLEEVDTIVNTIGPFSYFYFYLREKYNLKYNIVSDVRTAFMSGYYLQQYLCSPLIRSNDKFLFPSNFSRELYIKLFPTSLSHKNTFLSYPLVEHFKKVKKNDHGNSKKVVLGYIGRITNQKNIEQVFELFIKLFKEEKSDKEYHLHICGPIDMECSILGVNFKDLNKLLKKFDIPSERVKYLGPLPYNTIWKFYSNIDVLLFFSLANVETLGRILIEASHANVPVVASDYGAVRELIPADNIVKTLIDKKVFDMNDYFSLGKVDLEDAKEKIKDISKLKISEASKLDCYAKESFIDILKGLNLDNKVSSSALHKNVSGFINSLEINYDLKTCDKDVALKHIEKLIMFSNIYNGHTLLSIFFKKIPLFFKTASKSTNKKITFNIFAKNIIAKQTIAHKHFLAREFANLLSFKPRLNLENIEACQEEQ
ncbi:MAG: hypothetical protein CMP21_08680 [Rickettsiales bacterium]|nr:hypothetical protein [Rickettsiales bacterium]|tara:strand:+ start:2022 stop:3470 length:1449 start_codon:yes stop_codon:yes gene_type:complete